MQPATSRLLTLLLGYLVAQAKTYPMQAWPMYAQSPREYNDDEYYYAPKIQYYYDGPAMSLSEPHGLLPYPYYYDPYGNFVPNVIPKDQEERMAALPIGQETWFESDTTPDWQASEVDDVNAAFLDNLILTQMAQDAQRRRENARAAFAPVDYEERNLEDEDVRELKALAGKPLYHEPKTVPKFEEEDYPVDDSINEVPKSIPEFQEEDYPADDGFINWNGNKRSVTTAAPTTIFQKPTEAGQDEVMVPRPSQTHHQHQKETKNFYQTMTQLLATKSAKTPSQESQNKRRIEKRFISGDTDLVLELRGLKHRIPT